MVVKNIQISIVQVKGKSDCKSKKLKKGISTTSRQNSFHGLYHHPKGREKLLVPSVKLEDYENLFQNLLL